MSDPQVTYVHTKVCATEECGAQTPLMSSHCNYHEALRLARDLTPEALEALREEMESVVSVTDGERDARRIASRLWYVSHCAKALRTAEDSAHEAGATDEQIAAAMKEIR